MRYPRRLRAPRGARTAVDIVAEGVRHLCTACRRGDVANCSGVALYTPAVFIPCDNRKPGQALRGRQPDRNPEPTERNQPPTTPPG